MADIQHVVVLMLENRSFDSMLGRLYPQDPTFDGLTLNESNTYAGKPFGVWSSAALNSDASRIPTPDPGESFADMNEQLFGEGQPRTHAIPPMSGFVANYAKQEDVACLGNVMHFFTPEQVPMISTLAKAFGVCDRWHASAPCQTWPNRFFAHTGTAHGHVDNRTFRVPFLAESIFHRLQRAGRSWRVYFHDAPQSLLLGDVWLHALTHYRRFGQFLADAQTGNLPSYSFIEPRYFSDLFLNRIPNDEHPPHDVIYGEQLIAQVYNAVRSSPNWKSTLLIITYDEHGGCYDHVGPPAAAPPDANAQYGFPFDRFGVRVPAVLVSPYIAPGSKIRPPPGSPYPFDHTSIIATVRALFLPGSAPLTQRDAVAPNLLSALTLATPANDGPVSLDPGHAQPQPEEMTARGTAPANGMQKNLRAALATLPPSAPTEATNLPAPAAFTPVEDETVAVAQANAIAGTDQFLRVGLLG